MKRRQKEALLRQLLGAMGGTAPGAFLVDGQGNLIEASDEDAMLQPVQELSASAAGSMQSGSEWVCDDTEDPENE